MNVLTLITLLCVQLMLGQGSAQTLSEECSGYLPEDCREYGDCTTCWDGSRLDCFSSDSSQLYGNFWCEERRKPDDECEGLPEQRCGENPACVFCKSAAVGNACYLKEDAKKLPPAIFSCSWPAWSAKSPQRSRLDTLTSS